MKTEIVEAGVRRCVRLRDPASRRMVDRHLIWTVPVEIEIHDSVDDLPVAFRFRTFVDNSTTDVLWTGSRLMSMASFDRIKDDWRTALADPGQTIFSAIPGAGNDTAPRGDFAHRLTDADLADCAIAEDHVRNETRRLAVVNERLYREVPEPVWAAAPGEGSVRAAWFYTGQFGFAREWLFRADRIGDAFAYTGKAPGSTRGTIDIIMPELLRARPANAHLWQCAVTAVQRLADMLGRLPTENILVWTSLRDLSARILDPSILSREFVSVCEEFSYVQENLPLALRNESAMMTLALLKEALARRASDATRYPEEAIEGIDYTSIMSCGPGP